MAKLYGTVDSNGGDGLSVIHGSVSPREALDEVPIMDTDDEGGTESIEISW